MIIEVSIRCQKTPEVGIRRIPAYTPQYTAEYSMSLSENESMACKACYEEKCATKFLINRPTRKTVSKRQPGPCRARTCAGDIISAGRKNCRPWATAGEGLLPVLRIYILLEWSYLTQTTIKRSN